MTRIAEQPRLVSRKKRLAIIITVAALVLGGGGAAFAYWTSAGTGTGAATTGTSTAFTVTSTAATGGLLTPGGPVDSVPFTVTNPGTGTQALAAVVVTVANADGSPWTAVAGCSAADYTVGTPAITYGNIAPAGNIAGTVTITMINRPAVLQDGCKGATVPLYFAAS